ncbi:MAG: hypothetical protein A2Z17_05585 [Gammaproteobacteria bacterium RBG_16_66_13]|nr:MAG: hypothetical protein A2Z17_05585 [Gammaproteobacteria bacterium RBG_16_66_13]
MSNEHGPRPAPLQPLPVEMDGTAIREPGCYLHIASGLLTRIYQDDLGTDNPGHALSDAGQVARLSGDPDTPLNLLRIVASRHRYRVNF